MLHMANLSTKRINYNEMKMTLCTNLTKYDLLILETGLSSTYGEIWGIWPEKWLSMLDVQKFKFSVISKLKLT